MSSSLWCPCTAAHHASLSFTVSRSWLKLISIELVMPPHHFILCHPLFLPLLSIFPSFGVFSNESALSIKWPKDWSSSFSVNPSKEFSWLISFNIDWFDLLAVLGTLKSLLPTERKLLRQRSGPYSHWAWKLQSPIKQNHAGHPKHSASWQGPLNQDSV